MSSHIRPSIALLIVFASLSFATPASIASQVKVMPPAASPYGYSLADMAALAAPFNASGNDPSQYPDTPFQILYVAGLDFTPEGEGLFAAGGNEFTVENGTRLYVPIISSDDNAPVIGDFPSTSADAPQYFYDSSGLGVPEPSQVVVDGESTAVGARYMVGPVGTAPMPGGGSHVVALGVFVGPLTPGTHTIVVRTGFFGDAFAAATGLAFLRAEFTYVVHVV